MPDQISLLLRGLSQHFFEREQNYQANLPVIGKPEVMRQAVQVLQTTVGEKQGKPPTDRIQEALALLFQTGPEAALSSHLRYVCWGLLEPWGTTGRYLLAETHLFPKTLAGLEGLNGSLSKSSWRGLLSAYFGWSPHTQDTQTWKNWLELRRFLAVGLLPLARQQEGYQPAWLQVLAEHDNLLGDQPCGRYGQALLDGDDSELGPLRDELRIPKESWFWSQLLLSQIQAAIERDDAQFYLLLDALLPRIGEFPFARDAALRMLLDRYQQGRQRTTAHIGLRETAVTVWGSPHLEMNASWGLVKPETKAMVQNWLVVKALEDFFHLLQEDRAADERRLKFWLRYQQSIDYFHFALGPDAAENPQKDYQSFRKRFRDHICRLTSPGKRENNAFILKIQDYYIVEFGVVGNACYIYHKKNIPFQVGTAGLDLGRLKTKNKALFWLSHKGDWEFGFFAKLGEIGIHPDKDLPSSSKTPNQTKAQNSSSSTNSGTPDMDALYWQMKAIAEDYDFEINDQRSQGGALWASLNFQTGACAELLKSLGFKYHAGRGWWKK